MTDSKPEKQALKSHLMSLGEFINQRVDQEGVSSCKLLQPCIEEYLKLTKQNGEKTLVEWREIEKKVRSLSVHDWENLK